MNPELQVQLLGQLATTSNHYTQAITASMGRNSFFMEGVHNQQLHNLVISPSSAEELIAQMNTGATAQRMSQPPSLLP